ncbi:hypothetical protein [uncultured Thiohalocapsa sp.]|uniref:type III secretion apparatus assembly protein SctX n=1 Tax=uncultured Thiohalocapsa sp. TaxID=768990 RepID=UPI0025F197F8|nr:hypothetical protein [uncultured Thiohalocapsa sp.]
MQMQNEVADAYRLDVGIERLVRLEGPETTLPNSQDLSPAELPPLSRLGDLLPAGLDQRIEAMVMPHPADRSILGSRRYPALLSAAQQYLAGVAEQPGPHQQACREALAVLEEQATLKRLFDTYRGLLLRA